MRVLLVASALPPAIDGIGDYTATLARACAARASVAVAAPINRPAHPIDGVEILPTFDTSRSGSIDAIHHRVAEWKPDWIALQYNPFSWGRRGFNPHLPVAIRAIARTGTTKVALMVHERYVPFTTMKYRAMSLWQRPQYRALVRSADALFCSTDAWIPELRSIAPKCPVHLAPAGSGIPLVPMEREPARERLAVEPDDFVLGFFGFAHASKPLGHVRAAAQAIAAAGKKVKLLYIGLQPDVVREAIPGIDVLAEGALPPEEVSRRFAAMDLLLCPFTDGVSTRRTTLMTGLQHGIATLGTKGTYTSEALAREDGNSMRLVPCDDAGRFADAALELAADPALRRRIAEQGRALFMAEFAPEVLASRFLDALVAAA